VSARFDLVTLDTTDTERLASFWGSVLGLVEVEREDKDRWIVIGEPDGTRRVGIQRGEIRPGGVHLDLACDSREFDAELDRIVSAGAELVDRRTEPYGSIANLCDPAGYVFDLCAYD